MAKGGLVLLGKQPTRMSINRQKTALVTGASSGIGYATAIELSKRGYQVYAGARRLEPMELLKKYGIMPIQLDVSSIKSVIEARDKINEETGGYLDVLYNNAGQSCTFPSLDVTDEVFKQCYEVNVFGPMRMVREFRKLIINAKGVIGFTGSLSALLPFPFSSVYSSTKAAIHQYASTLALEMKPFGVRVVNIVTGGVSTNIADTRPLPEGSIYSVEGMKEAMKERQQMAVRNKPMDADKYAKQVVDDFERIGWFTLFSNVYRGSQTVLVRFVSILPRGLLEWGLIRKFLLTNVFQTIREKYSKTKIE